MEFNFPGLWTSIVVSSIITLVGGFVLNHVIGGAIANRYQEQLKNLEASLKAKFDKEALERKATLDLDLEKSKTELLKASAQQARIQTVQMCPFSERKNF